MIESCIDSTRFGSDISQSPNRNWTLFCTQQACMCIVSHASQQRMYTLPARIVKHNLNSTLPASQILHVHLLPHQQMEDVNVQKAQVQL